LFVNIFLVWISQSSAGAIGLPGLRSNELSPGELSLLEKETNFAPVSFILEEVDTGIIGRYDSSTNKWLDSWANGHLCCCRNWRKKQILL
jgi:hypothetical protein